MTDIGQLLLLVLHIYWNIRHHQLILLIKVDFGLCKFFSSSVRAHAQLAKRCHVDFRDQSRRLSRPVWPPSWSAAGLKMGRFPPVPVSSFFSGIGVARWIKTLLVQVQVNDQ